MTADDEDRCSLIVFTPEHAYTFEGSRLGMMKLHDDLKRAIMDRAVVFEALCGRRIADIIPGCVSGMEIIEIVPGENCQHQENL
jgi:hypothetical protein